MSCCPFCLFVCLFVCFCLLSSLLAFFLAVPFFFGGGGVVVGKQKWTKKTGSAGIVFVVLANVVLGPQQNTNQNEIRGRVR